MAEDRASRLRAIALRWERACLPETLLAEGASPIALRRARMLLWVISACPPGIALAWLANRAIGRAPNPVETVAELGMLSVLLLLPLLRRGVDVALLGRLFGSVLLAVAFVPVVAYQGHALPATLLVTTFPAITLVLVGLRAALVSCAVVVFGLGAVGLLAELRSDLALPLPVSVQERWLFVVPALLTMIQTTLVALIETSRKRSVEELQTSREALAESEMRFRAVFEAASLGIGVVDLHGEALDVNPAGRRMLALRPGTLPDERALLSCIHPDDVQRAFLALRRALDGHEDPPMELRWVRPGRHLDWAEVTVAVVREPDGVPRFLVGCAEFISERKASEERIRALAFFDGVTGLGNRQLFVDRLSRALDVAGTRGHQVGVLFLDLDGFKQVNDRCGHDAGDEVLAIIAERFASSLRLSDRMGRIPDVVDLARYGGDEFAVLLAAVDGPKGAEVVARRLAGALERPIEVAEDSFSFGVSIGIALYPDHGDGVEALVRHADAAMYRAKKEQGSAVAFHGDGPAQRI